MSAHNTNAIFVFGSNLRGIHGAGAALQARMRHGAVAGVGEGRAGASYAIPTKTFPSMKPEHRRPLADIAASVSTFIAYAAAHPEMTFLVTRVGCGLAGNRDEDIAPLFADALAHDNILLPEDWHTLLFGAVRRERISFPAGM